VHDDDLALALELADLADDVTMGRFRAVDLAMERKPDTTWVSEADRAAEIALRQVILASRPGHSVLGEEHGVAGDAESPWRWVLDPIDGTGNYVRGMPVWATLIALQHEGRSVVGVVSAPALGRRWWAAQGSGAFATDLAAGGDPRPLQVSAVADVGDAFLAYDDVPGFEKVGLGDAFLALCRRCWRTRGFGDFWSHMLVAEGVVDVAVEPEVALWDLAALQVVVEEAGGRFTDLSGTARPDGGSAVSTNGALHDEVLAALVASAPCDEAAVPPLTSSP
jgi:histidinol-phosphatase